ncbi:MULTISPECIES: RNA ligase family protein [unclassified Cupriavidus]|uniref:ATP-dependent DNA ligase n=2 Tax=Cupriavidus TaxID=106589 RepID=UPI001F1AE53F|nr:RNA ligase family protein [Cupriavidus sp. SW-Y-13]
MPRAMAQLDLAAFAPMLPSLRKSLPRGEGWWAEVKYDGYRALALTGSVPSVRTKNGADCTPWFPELLQSLRALPASTVLDGEVCVLDAVGRADFERLHRRARRKCWYEGADPIVYCVFDILAFRGRDVRVLPIEERKAMLRPLLASLPGLLYVQAVLDQSDWLFANALALNLEGIVCKRASSPYRAGPSVDWIKVRRRGVHEHGAFRRGP